MEILDNYILCWGREEQQRETEIDVECRKSHYRYSNVLTGKHLSKRFEHKTTVLLEQRLYKNGVNPQWSTLVSIQN